MPLFQILIEGRIAFLVAEVTSWRLRAGFRLPPLRRNMMSPKKRTMNFT